MTGECPVPQGDVGWLLAEPDQPPTWDDALRTFASFGLVTTPTLRPVGALGVTLAYELDGVRVRGRDDALAMLARFVRLGVLHTRTRSEQISVYQRLCRLWRRNGWGEAPLRMRGRSIIWRHDREIDWSDR